MACVYGILRSNISISGIKNGVNNIVVYNFACGFCVPDVVNERKRLQGYTAYNRKQLSP